MNQDESFFREVDEDYRRDQLLQLVRKYGIYAVGAAFIIVAIVGGYTYEKRRAASEAAKGGEEFMRALTLAETGKQDEAGKVLSQLADHGPGVYKALARLKEAQSAGGKPGKDAAAIYRAVIEDGTAPQSFRDFAKIQLATLSVDTESYEALSRDLAPLRAGTSPWRFSAREILGLSAMKAGKPAEAEKLFGELMSDGEAPSGMRQRAEIMLGLLFEKPKQQKNVSGAKETANDSKTQ